MIELLLDKLLDLAVGVASASISSQLLAKPTGTKRDETLIRVADETSSRQKVSASLNAHFLEIKQWSSSVAFSDLKEHKRLSGIYVELDTYLMPARTHIDAQERLQRQPLRTVLQKTFGHVVILGAPGAGKTTSLKMLCHEQLAERNPLPNLQFPLLVRLREESILKLRRPVLDSLRAVLPLCIEPKTVQGQANGSLTTQPAVDEAYIEYLQEFRPLILLDGLDEMSSQSAKETVVAEFRELSRKLTRCMMVLTSRSAEFPYTVQGASIYEIAPLTDPQVNSFALKWLGSEESASVFAKLVLNSPYADTTLRPLSLAHLCAIYERTQRIPEQPKWVYRKVVNLLISEWDEQQSIKRTSRYAKFDSGQKFDFLCNLGFHLTVERSAFVFGHAELVAAYRTICRNFKLPPDEASQVAEEIEAHTGLLVEASYRRYEFAHKSIQEYLVAEFINRSSLRTITKRLGLLGNEVAIAVSISVDPTRYFAELVLTWISASASFPPEFLPTFLARLKVERPLFYPSQEGTLALIVIAGMGADIETLKKFLPDLTGDLGQQTLKEFFTQGDKVGARIGLVRTHPHHDFALPVSIYVPEEFLNLLL